MGTCLSLNCARCDMCLDSAFYERKGYQSNMKTKDLDRVTFSHYSLTSETSFLDLYPTLRFMENDQSNSSARTESCCEEYNNWRNSSLPLIDDVENALEHRCTHTNDSKETNMVCSDCLNDSHVMVHNNPEMINKSKNMTINGPDTSSIMNSENKFSNNTECRIESINGSRLDEYSQSYDNFVGDPFTAKLDYKDTSKDELERDIDAPLSVEEEVQGAGMLPPKLKEDTCFGYTNLGDELNIISQRSRLASRLKFNKKLKISDALCSNP
jgi:hypothetical protein